VLLGAQFMAPPFLSVEGNMLIKILKLLTILINNKFPGNHKIQLMFFFVS